MAVAGPGVSPSEALARLVDRDSEPAGYSGLGRDIDPGDKPFAGFFDQQRRAAISPGSRAIVPQQQLPAGISRTSDNTALGIRHQNKWMILLVAAEPDGIPDLRWLADHRQDTIR